ncbi:MAG TPA: alpha/beta fold hydrolase [Thermoanaerobaculia bacterium]|nr:alpha/beta fold hydrolase [Thermoanaerobaculia bacterium]
MDQNLGFCTTPDGVRLAFATAGEGPPLVKAANWLNHLEYDWHSPVWRHLFRALALDRTLVRYDERGTGLSDWNVGEFGFDEMVEDLETVVDHLELERFDLFGISQGCAVSAAYAVRHPDRVKKMVLYGGYSRGWAKRGNRAEMEERRALLTLVRHGWGMRSREFRDLWTRNFIPEGTAEQQEWWSELQKVSTSAENAAAILESFGNIDVRDLLPKVAVPTLVIHSRNERVAPLEQGEELARLIPGSCFVVLESSNHLVLEHEPAWPVFVRAVGDFLGIQRFVEEARSSSSLTRSGSTAQLSGPPGLVVAPFEELSGHATPSGFADGLREDLLTRLAEWRGAMRVVVGGSSVDSRSGAAPYTLEGSLRIAGDRLRLNVKVVAAPDGVPVMSERFDRTVKDAFEAQDEIARAVAAAVGPAVWWAEAERSAAADRDRLDAWELVQRGWWHLWRFSRDETEVAADLFAEGAASAPGMTMAHYGVAMALFHRLLNQWHQDPKTAMRELRRAAESAVAADERSHLGHVALACAEALEGALHEAVLAAEHAVALSPTAGWAQIQLATFVSLAGDPERGLELLRATKTLESRDALSWSYDFTFAIADFAAGRLEAAAEALEGCVQRRPDWLPARQLLAACFALTGRLGDAGRALERSASHAAPPTPLLAVAHRSVAEPFLDGLRRAREAAGLTGAPTVADEGVLGDRLATGGALRGGVGRGLARELGIELGRAPGTEISVGDVIGRYRITGELGAGGMGLVFQGIDSRLGRAVALKLLPEHLSDDLSMRERFEREARAASSLNHPNICTIFEIDEQDGRPFMAFELLEGAVLSEGIRRGPIRGRELVDIALDVASGLEAAHTKGLVHRDIKPSNLFVTDSGVTKILDFGVAKRVRVPQEQAAVDDPLQHTLTAPGAIPGTLAYMSPEQALGRELDARSDLFSLGAVLYEAASGRRPFRAPTTGALIQLILHEEPEPLDGLAPGIDAELASVVARLLRKAPEERTPSARRLREELDGIRRRLSRESETGSRGGSGVVRRWWRRFKGEDTQGTGDRR